MANPRFQRQAIQAFMNYTPSRYAINVYRLVTLPLAQIMMAVGVFPGQFVSGLMKTVRRVPLIKNHAVIIAKTFGVGRTAYQVWSQDYLKSTQAFDYPVPPRHQDTRHLTINEKSHYRVPYISKFGIPHTLETYSFEHEEFKNIPAEEQYYRIHASGNNGSCGRFFSELAAISQARPELKCITYNHPGVEGSTGLTLTQDDLIDALCTQVKNLLNKGVKPQNIELTGFSIGAATAAIATRKLQDQGIEVNSFCASTFGSMAAVVTNNIPIVGDALRYLKTIPLIRWLALGIQKMIEWGFIKPILIICNWDLTPAEAYKELNPDRKALTFVKPESIGKGIFKKIAKFMGQFTGLFKRHNIDRVTPAHVSLASEVNLKGERKQSYKAAMQNLYEPRFRQVNFSTAYNESDNAISRNALKRLNEKLKDEDNDPASSTQLINLAVLGWKGRRMQGTQKKDAHYVLAQNLRIREVKNQRWFSPDQKDFKDLANSALAATGGYYEDDAPLSGVTYYLLFHDAIKRHNQMLKMQEQTRLKTAEVETSEESCSITPVCA